MICRPINRREALAGLGAALAMRAVRATARSLDVAYLNARLWTGKPGGERATAFGTFGNRIAAVGDDAQVRALAGKKTKVVDLGGAFAMPGFIDNHTHFLRASLLLGQPELRGAKSREEFVARVAEEARKLPPGRWLQGGNWDEQMWGGELPARHWIDPVTPNTPVAVVRLDLHIVLLNSLALKIAGIDRNTPDPQGGVIVRDAQGEPTGLLKDKARNLYKPFIPPNAEAEIDASIRAGIVHARSKGVTQIHLTEIDWVAHHALRRIRAQGEPGLRFYSFVPIEDWKQLKALVDAEGRGDDWVRWGAVKGLVDGSLGARTALFYEPYSDDPGNHGIRRTPADELKRLVIGADAAGLQVAVHAIGDEANDEVLELVAQMIATNGARDRRFRVEHAQHLRAQDIPRFAKENVIASMQPYHAIDDGRWAGKPLGPDRVSRSWAIRALLDAKVRVTFGSDWPVAPIDPLLGIEAAVLRRTIDGANPGGWVPQQRITVPEALTAYTTSNAYAGLQDDRLGLIAEGYLADVTVLDKDLTRCAPDEISRAKVLRTLVNGVAAQPAH